MISVCVHNTESDAYHMSYCWISYRQVYKKYSPVEPTHRTPWATTHITPSIHKDLHILFLCQKYYLFPIHCIMCYFLLLNWMNFVWPLELRFRFLAVNYIMTTCKGDHCAYKAVSFCDLHLYSPLDCSALFGTACICHTRCWIILSLAFGVMLGI